MSQDLPSVERMAAAVTTALWNYVEERDPASRFFVPLPVQPARKALEKLVIDSWGYEPEERQEVLNRLAKDFSEAKPAERWASGILMLETLDRVDGARRRVMGAERV